MISSPIAASDLIDTKDKEKPRFGGVFCCRRHCEEPQATWQSRLKNQECAGRRLRLDCFALLAMMAL
jgi:hypothetical protein